MDSPSFFHQLIWNVNSWVGFILISLIKSLPKYFSKTGILKQVNPHQNVQHNVFFTAFVPNFVRLFYFLLYFIYIISIILSDFLWVNCCLTLLPIFKSFWRVLLILLPNFFFKDFWSDHNNVPVYF